MNLPFSNEVLYPGAQAPGLVHRIGNVYRNQMGDYYLLALDGSGPRVVILTCLGDGEGWDVPEGVANPFGLTAQEWEQVCGYPHEWEYRGRLRPSETIDGFVLEKIKAK